MDIPPNLGYGDQQQTKHSKTSPFVRNPSVMVRRHISIFTDLKETALSFPLRGVSNSKIRDQWPCMDEG